MTSGRDAWRNIHFIDATTKEKLGGCFQKGSLNDATLIWILKSVLLLVEDGEELTIIHRETGRTLRSSSNISEIGNYDIFCAKPIRLTDEQWVARITSHSASGQKSPFRDGVRARDRNCVISGISNCLAPYGQYLGFQTTHIFPLESESLWIQHGFERWITNMDNVSGASRLHSIQNGLLMNAGAHELFDQYLFSINPDDGYKIISFFPNEFKIDGRILDFVSRDPANPDRVSDEVLRWHFRQSILANMRGEGEPLFEHDFPPGSDQMATLRAEPYGKERFEKEMMRRLGSNTGSDKD